MVCFACLACTGCHLSVISRQLRVPAQGDVNEAFLEALGVLHQKLDFLSTSALAQVRAPLALVSTGLIASLPASTWGRALDFRCHARPYVSAAYLAWKRSVWCEAEPEVDSAGHWTGSSSCDMTWSDPCAVVGGVLGRDAGAGAAAHPRGRQGARVPDGQDLPPPPAEDQHPDPAAEPAPQVSLAPPHRALQLDPTQSAPQLPYAEVAASFSLKPTDNPKRRKTC